VPVLKHPHERPAMTAFDIFSFNAEYLRCKGVSHDSQTDPPDALLTERHIKEVTTNTPVLTQFK